MPEASVSLSNKMPGKKDSSDADFRNDVSNQRHSQLSKIERPAVPDQNDFLPELILSDGGRGNAAA